MSRFRPYHIPVDTRLSDPVCNPEKIGLKIHHHQ
jgi:hypothetical protein